MAQPNGVPNSNMLIKPDQITSLPFLDEGKKLTYKNGLANLWRQYESNPPGSQERNTAEMRIRQASQKIMQDISRNNRPGSGSAASPQGQPQQRPASSGPQQSGVPPQAGMHPSNPGAMAAQPQPSQPVTNQIPPQVRQTLDSITIHVPHQLPAAQHGAYKAKWYQQAAQHLIGRERLVTGGRQLQHRLQQAQTAGQDIPAALQNQFENAKRQLREIDAKWGAMRTNNEQNGRLNAQAMAMQNGTNSTNAAAAAAAAGGAAGASQISQPPASQAPTMPPATAAPDVKLEQRVAAAPAPPSATFQQSAATAATPQSATMPPQLPQQQSSAQPAMPQPFPANANQRPPMPQLGAPGQQQHQQQPMSGAMQQHPPTANAGVAGGPTAQQNARPQPLSQQAAMAQAAEQYARGLSHGQPGAGQPQPPPPSAMANNAPFAQQPGVGGQNTPNSAYPPPHQMQAAQQPPTNKFPIGKTVQLDPRTQSAVQGLPSRPTLANQGVLSQPGLARPQPFTLEGEGDRVLSKRKLDELVRQVTGAADGSPEAGGLAPDVEEAILAMADDFVDNVITSACRLAKLRSGQTLDIKDVQMVLERNYGIRVPGYSLDEVRTVRKFQPAPGWQSKMQAIQTAKTLGGVGKSDG